MAIGLEHELAGLHALVQRGELRGALQLLNKRTSFRYTAVFSCEGEVLRNVSLFDRWNPATGHRPDVPLNTTYCAIVERNELPLGVADSRDRARFPELKDSAVGAYCGAPIHDSTGRVIGTLCHFDVRPSEAARTELPLLALAAELFAPHVLALRADAPTAGADSVLLPEER